MNNRRRSRADQDRIREDVKAAMAKPRGEPLPPASPIGFAAEVSEGIMDRQAKAEMPENGLELSRLSTENSLLREQVKALEEALRRCAELERKLSEFDAANAEAASYLAENPIEANYPDERRLRSALGRIELALGRLERGRKRAEQHG